MDLTDRLPALASAVTNGLVLDPLNRLVTACTITEVTRRFGRKCVTTFWVFRAPPGRLRHFTAMSPSRLLGHGMALLATGLGPATGLPLGGLPAPDLPLARGILAVALVPPPWPEAVLAALPMAGSHGEAARPSSPTSPASLTAPSASMLGSAHGR